MTPDYRILKRKYYRLKQSVQPANAKSIGQQWVRCAAGMVGLLILVGAVTSLPANEPGDRIKAEGWRKDKIQRLERDIYRYHRDIQNLYRYIQEVGIIDSRRITKMPLLVEHRSHNPNPDRDVYSTDAEIKWSDNNRIEYIFIKERDIIDKTFNQERKLWYGQALGIESHNDEEETVVFDGYAINLITVDVVESGTLNRVNYSLFSGYDLRDSQTTAQLPVDPPYENMERVYITEPDRRIVLMEEYLQHLRLLERRLLYFTRNVRGGLEADLDFKF